VATRLTRHTSPRYNYGHVARGSRCSCMSIKQRANGKCKKRNVVLPSPAVPPNLLCSLLPSSLFPSASSSTLERSSQFLGQMIACLFQDRKQRDARLQSSCTLRSRFPPVKGFLQLFDELAVWKSDLTLYWRSRHSGRHDYVLLRVAASTSRSCASLTALYPRLSCASLHSPTAIFNIVSIDSFLLSKTLSIPWLG